LKQSLPQSRRRNRSVGFGNLAYIGAAQTIERVIGAFPPSAQAQIRTQLAGVLRGIVTQQLIPRQDSNNELLHTEILVVNEGVAHNDSRE
jgi:twitching motility protein PilT